LVYLCAVVTLASGIGLLWRRTAALAARVLLALFVLWLLVWRIPVARGSLSAFQWGEVVITVALTVAGWVVADSYRSGQS